MFVREKRIGRYTYVYLVETVREDGRTRQRIIRNLGRKEDVERRGDLDRLARSAARLAQRSMILSLIDEGSAPALSCKRLGPPLLFERLWRDTGCREVVAELLTGRGFEFPVERAVFLTVLHRVMISGSDRACDQWRSDYRIAGVDGLQLHHLYRAMAWLGEELEERLTTARLKPEWRELLADLDRLQEIEVEQDGKHFILRTPVTGVAGKAFQAVGAALPPNIREAVPSVAT